MALYLGNQKVSLRSGQDPTFDYGFDSNGRLVFANKNATEINNFLNYDSSYSEILDLSNLSKMEKVAVNGTADRKMEGLKGLLVSPNAPFTGSSPQINASYTGLNKSALVSLFESAPYNVGYTKVGNPTIVDGVASGCDYHNYLNLNSLFPDINNSDMDVFITLKSAGIGAGKGFRNVFSNLFGTISLTNSSTPAFIVYTKKSGESKFTKRDIYNYSAQVNSNNNFYLHFTKKGNVLSIQGANNDGVFKNASTYTLEEGEEIAVSSNYPEVMRADTWSSIENSAIDLNNTYIKVNGVPWFTGKADMTKTCSIVGATGTADLTQEDKNIILNKGWSLTVQ